MPKWPKARPDFLAPGPRVLVDKAVVFEEEEELDSPGDHDLELHEVASYEAPQIHYYESTKVLGQLYRDIDEQKFFQDIQKQSRPSTSSASTNKSLADAVWKYVLEKVALIQWRHWLDFAKDIRDGSVIRTLRNEP